MKLYCLHKMAEVGQSFGYDFFSSRKEAEKALREWKKDDEEEDTHGTKIEVIEVKPSKKGILKALNRWASHPDNG